MTLCWVRLWEVCSHEVKSKEEIWHLKKWQQELVLGIWSVIVTENWVLHGRISLSFKRIQFRKKGRGGRRYSFTGVRRAEGKRDSGLRKRKQIFPGGLPLRSLELRTQPARRSPAGRSPAGPQVRTEVRPPASEGPAFTGLSRVKTETCASGTLRIPCQKWPERIKIFF